MSFAHALTCMGVSIDASDSQNVKNFGEALSLVAFWKTPPLMHVSNVMSDNEKKNPLLILQIVSLLDQCCQQSLKPLALRVFD